MKQKYSLIKQITPPVLFSAIERIRDKIKRNTVAMNQNLSWNTIEDGPLSGYKLYGDKTALWLKEMIEGVYDKEIFKYIDKFDLLGKTVVEIGAHIGYHTLVFAKKVGKNGDVFSFEPNPFNVERLKININENETLKNKVTVFEMALSDKKGKEEFVFGSRVDKGSSSGSFLDRAHTVYEKSIYESEKIGFKRMFVQTKTLDSLRKDGTIKNPIALCKIDVEGAEYLVLSGAVEVLKNDRPVVLLEIHSIFNMWKVKEIFDRERYILKLLKEEPDGRCFFCANPQ